MNFLAQSAFLISILLVVFGVAGVIMLIRKLVSKSQGKQADPQD